MAVVGTAYVVVKALTNSLRRDISDAVTRAAEAAAPAATRAGETLGQSVGGGIGDGIGDAPSSPRTMGQFRRALTRMAEAARPESTGRGIGERMTRGILGAVSSFSLPRHSWLVALAIPALGGAMKILASYIGGAIALIGAIGPAFAAAGVVGVAGVGVLISAFAAAMLAFKAETQTLKRFQENLKAVGAEFSSVGIAAQRELLPKLSNAFSTVVATVPVLRTGMAQVASAMGDVAIRLAGVVTSAANLERFARIFEGNAVTVGLLGGALASLVNVLAILADVGQPLLVMFAGWIARWSEAASAAAEAGAASGTLAAFMERAAGVASQLGSILGDTFGGLFGLFSASSGAGQVLLDRIGALAQRFNDWANSVEGRNSIAQFFEGALPILQAFNGLIGDIARAIGQSVSGDNAGVLEFIRVMRADGLPAMQAIASALAPLGPALVAVIGSVSVLFERLAQTGVLGAFTATLVGIINAISALLAMPVVGDIAAMALSFLAAAKAVDFFLKPFGGVAALARPLSAVFGLLRTGITALGGVVLNLARAALPLLMVGIRAVGAALMANPIGLVIGLIALLVTGVVLAYQRFEGFRRVVDQVGAAISSGFGAALTWLTGVWDSVWTGMVAGWNWIRGAFSSGVAFVTGIVGRITDGWNAVVTGFSAGVDWIRGMFLRLAPIFNVITQPIQGLIQVVTGVVQTIRGLFTGNWDEVTTGIANVIGGIVRTFFGLPSRVIQAIIPLIPSILAWIGSVWASIASGIAAGWSATIAFFVALPGNVYNAVSSLVVTLGAWMTGVWASIIAAVVTGIVNVIAFYVALPGRIMSAVASFAALARAWMANAWANIVAAITTGIANAISFYAALPGRIISAVSGFAASARAWMNNAWAEISSAITTGISNAISLFSSLPSRISSAVGSLRTTLYSAGSDLLQGLINGINSMWDRVTGLAAELAGKVKSTIQSALGIASPSKVTTEIGRFVGLGLINGLRRMIEPIGRMAGKVAGAATPKIAPVTMGVTTVTPLSGGGGGRRPPFDPAGGTGGNAGAGIVFQKGAVEVNVPNSMNEEQVGSHVMTKIGTALSSGATPTLAPVGEAGRG